MTLVSCCPRLSGTTISHGEHCEKKTRGYAEADSSRIHFVPFLCLAFKCLQSVSLGHYRIGRTYFTEQMKVFLLLLTSAL